MRLLVAEDDEKLARALDRGLRRAGYGVDVAHDGEAALLNARVYEYDALVLDVMLPARDGFDVCRTLREESHWTPVLLLTARDQVADRIHGLDAGADDYLVKPFDFGELLVDPATRGVTRAGTAVELTAREFGVLEHLARKPGQVVSRTELLEHVWDENFYGSTNVVDVYVGYLRAKLERPFGGRGLIHTVRGAGYRLEPE